VCSGRPKQPDRTSAKSPILGRYSSAQPSLSALSMGLLPWLIAVAFFMESLDTAIYVSYPRGAFDFR
jgi:hypothetical protein